MAFMCPICDESLTTAAPNYEKRLSVAGHVEQASPTMPPRKTGGSGETTSTPKSPIIITPCGHLFHRVCLDEWFKRSGPRSCPSCRKTCELTKMIQAFPVVSEQGHQSRDNTTGEFTTSGGSSISVITFTGNSRNQETSSAQNRVNPVAFQELKSTHATLIHDYGELTARYNEKVDEYAISQSIVKSYESSFEQLSEENQKLKRELSILREERPSETVHGSKNIIGGSTKESASRKRTVLTATSTGSSATSSVVPAAGSSPTSVVVPMPTKRGRGRPKGVQEKTSYFNS